MSVRSGLLAVLTLGPAYGLQLHAEFTDRAPHRGPVNVGQVYGTLERLSKQNLVEPAGTTDDGLPMHRLTEAGRDEAACWMHEPLLESLPEWTEMLDQVLVTSSIDSPAAEGLAESFRRWWEADLAGTRVAASADTLPVDARLALVAREAQGVAAIAWLGAAIATLSDYDAFRGPSEVRPRRGRKRAGYLA